MHGITKKCPICEKNRYTVEKRPRDTSYVDDENNYLTSCIECYARDCEYYAERWAEYYADCM